MMRRYVACAAMFALTLMFADLAVAHVAATELPAVREHYHPLPVVHLDNLADHHANGEAFDVLFMGSSQTYRGVNPTVFDQLTGLSSYNAGLSAGHPPIMKSWIPDVVLPALRSDPATVVWSLSTLDVRDDKGVDDATDKYYRAHRTAVGIGADIERAIAPISAIVRYRDHLSNPSMVDWIRQPADPDAGRPVIDDKYTSNLGILRRNLTDRGFIATPTLKTEGWRERALAKKGQWRPVPERYDEITDTIRGLQQRGIRVVVVAFPVSPVFTEMHPHGQADIDAAVASFEQIAEQTGADFIDLSTGWTDADFADVTHLVAQGADTYTRALADAMIDRGLAPRAPWRGLLERLLRGGDLSQRNLNGAT